MNIKQLLDKLDILIYEDNVGPIYGVSREFNSYRGYYECLAMAPNETRSMSICEFYNVLADQIGKTYTGYKGGEYKMTESTEFYCANYGECGNSVAGVEPYKGGIRLVLLDREN